MKKKSVGLIIGLMSVALLGVIGMQVYFLRESYRLKAELFDQSVNESLNNVITGLQKQEAAFFLKKQRAAGEKAISHRQTDIAGTSTKTSKKVLSPAYRNAQRALNAYIKQQKASDALFDTRVANLKREYPAVALIAKIPMVNEDEDHVQITVQQLELGNQVIGQQQLAEVIPGQASIRTDIARYLKNVLPARTDTVSRFMVVDSFGRPTIREMKKPVIRKLSGVSGKQPADNGMAMGRPVALSIKAARKLADSVNIVKKEGVLREQAQHELAQQWQFSERPFVQRTKNLDSLLKAELLNHGIKAAYQSIVDSTTKAKSIFVNAADKSEPLPENTYRKALFPDEFMKSSVGSLTVIFPGKSTLLLAKMGAMMGASAALSLALLACFGYTLYSILRQKKISEMKTDFINNMTHEFKTPVSTIMIASEGLKDPEVSADRNRVARLAGIIYDENIRLSNHIERVLNIAKIDREDLKLEHKPVEMNELVAAVTDSMALQLQKRNATVELDLGAKAAIVQGDELHLSNVLYNLLDNAIKYSLDEPQIAISTSNTGKQLSIKIADNGIGMSRDQLTRIFEQFYRIPTGNLHDVKGFGLGLSYVNNIVKKLDGSVRVKSEKDKGSEFELTFPVI